jgi:phage shock protein PspC (stress-responsive transcriptional regulator)
MQTEPFEPQVTPVKKLFRLKNNRMIGGVCAGFAEYLNLDPVLVRVVWILLVIWGGVGILAYFAGLILMPENPAEAVVARSAERATENSSIIWGILLVLFGLFFLSDEFDFWDFHWFFFWPRFFHWDIFWPTLIILAGIIYIIYVLHKQTETGERLEMPKEWGTGGKRLYRVTSRKMLSGVCAGVAEYLNVDVVFVRLGWVVFTIFANWFSIVSYVVLAIALPTENSESTPARASAASVEPETSENLNFKKEESI